MGRADRWGGGTREPPLSVAAPEVLCSFAPGARRYGGTTEVREVSRLTAERPLHTIAEIGVASVQRFAADTGEHICNQRPPISVMDA